MLHLLISIIVGVVGPRELTSKPSDAHCLEYIAASPEGGWLQVRNVCREAVRGSLWADFGYCDFDVGCYDGGDVMVEPGACATLVIDEGESVIGELCALGFYLFVDGEPGNVLLIGDEDVCIDGFSADGIDAPEPWPGEAVYLIDGLWQRSMDVGPPVC